MVPFVPTAELVDALDVEPTALGLQMGELAHHPCPCRIITENGTRRQARGHLIAGIRAAIASSGATRSPTTVQSELVAPGTA
jgi:DNA segregation ATPase FtsK/SpoIIIE, S-DNA-T family